MEEDTESVISFRGGDSEDDHINLTPDLQMKRGLFSASRKPAEIRDIKSFQALHNPRIHGMTEWMVQYEKACRRQELYLQQIRSLRLQFSNRADSSQTSKVLEPSPRKRLPHDYWQKPSSPSLPPVKRPGERRPHQLCLLYPRTLKPLAGNMSVLKPIVRNTEFLLAPRSMLRPGIEATGQKIGPKRVSRSPVRFPQLGKLDRNQTDYEPIEHIVQRNKLNLNKYLESKKGQTVWARIVPRKQLDVTDVCVQAKIT